MSEEIHVGDIGTVFEVTLKDGAVVVDISTATETVFYFLKPDKAVVEKTASFKTDGEDGVLQYATVEGDLDMKGTWKLQAKVTLPTGTWSSDIGTFSVAKNLYA